MTGSVNKDVAVSFSMWNVRTYIWQHWGCRGIRLRINIVMTGAREKGKLYEAVSSRVFPAFYQLNICVGRTYSSGFQLPSASRASSYGVGHKQTTYALLAQGCPLPTLEGVGYSTRTVHTWTAVFIAPAHDRIIEGWGVFKWTTAHACLTDYETNVVGLPLKENEQKLEVKSGNTNEVFAFAFSL